MNRIQTFLTKANNCNLSRLENSNLQKLNDNLFLINTLAKKSERPNVKKLQNLVHIEMYKRDCFDVVKPKNI
mgnify:FL=1|tara:strand:- start:245 stop:460 length:216 start_codon:yes stop_codon:yes gene_type:complete